MAPRSKWPALISVLITAALVPSASATTVTYTSSFGTEGAGKGQFKHPADVDVDSKGNIWVVDKGNNRLEKFNNKGEFLLEVGTSGSGDGQFSGPSAIVVDKYDEIYVADTNNNRIEAFNAEGKYLFKAGSFGTGNLQFDGPEGIALDPEGNVWVSDTSNSRLQELTLLLKFIQTVGTKGSEYGQLGEPTAIDIAKGKNQSGNIYVTDWQNNRVARFNLKGEPIGKWIGTEGSGDGQFKHPVALDIDSSLHIWVGDEKNNRVEQFATASGDAMLSKFGSAGSGPGQFNFGFPAGIATDIQGNMWIADSNNNRIQKWSIEKYVPEYVGAFGSPGTGNGQFKDPSDIATDSKGNLWITDTGNDRVQKFNAAGSYLSQFGTEGAGKGQFNSPAWLAIDGSDNVWVVDQGNNRVEEFNSSGEYVTKFGSFGSAPGQFNHPEGIAFDNKYGHVWVVDSGNNRLQIFSKTGELLQVVGSKGTGPGQFLAPAGIDFEFAGGDAVVVDSLNGRIERFDLKSGEFVEEFRVPEAYETRVSMASGIAGSLSIGVLAANSFSGFSDPIVGFNPSLEFMTIFGEGEIGSAEGIAIASRSIWVTDTTNYQVVHWTF